METRAKKELLDRLSPQNLVAIAAGSSVLMWGGIFGLLLSTS